MHNIDIEDSNCLSWCKRILHHVHPHRILTKARASLGTNRCLQKNGVQCIRLNCSWAPKMTDYLLQRLLSSSAFQHPGLYWAFETNEEELQTKFCSFTDGSRSLGEWLPFPPIDWTLVSEKWYSIPVKYTIDSWEEKCYQHEENENEGSLETPDELGLTCTDKALVGNSRIATSLTLLISSNSHSSLYSRFSKSLPTCNVKRNFRLVKSNSVDTLEADDHCQLAVPSETRQLRYSLPCSKCPHWKLPPPT